MSSLKRLYPEEDMFFQSGDTVTYLIHLSQKIGRCQHYLGSCETDRFDDRIREHQKTPYYKLTPFRLKRLSKSIPSDLAMRLLPLMNRKFYRKHRLLGAVEGILGTKSTLTYQIDIVRAASQRKGSPLLMEANRRGVSWFVSEVWQAGREFEMFLKSKKVNFQRFCPLCHNETPEYLPF